MQEFLKNFAEQFDDTPIESISLSTHFKDLEEWSSMTALSIIAMVDECYGKKLTGDDIRKSNTVEDLYTVVNNK